MTGLALLSCLLVVTGLSGSARAAGIETYRDDFTSISYGGNNGTASWTGSWVESGESDGPGSGRARVEAAGECLAGNCATFTGNGNTTVGIQRSADLSGAESAVLTYNYRRTKVGNSPSIVRVSASANGGSTWSTVASYTLDTTDPTTNLATVNVSSFVAGNTAIRFRVESSPGDGGRFHVDSVQIAANFPDLPTTTTTSTTSTTTTTTTAPGPTTTTTTTTPPGPTTTTTTTVPPGPTTTTTTTLPPGPTTTLFPATTTTLPASTTTSLPPTTTPTTVPTTPAPAVTTTAVVAAPSSPAPPQATRPPFPIDPSSGASFLGSAGTLSVPEGVDLTSASHEVSDLVVVDMAAPVASQATIGTTVPVDGSLVRYVWPGIVLLALLAAASLISARRFF